MTGGERKGKGRRERRKVKGEKEGEGREEVKEKRGRVHNIKLSGAHRSLLALSLPFH